MPKKARDPIVGIINYFESISVDRAELAAAIVKEIVRRRAGKTEPAGVTRGRPKKRAEDALEAEG